MTQTSEATGNRREFLEAILHYRRAFKAHHINGTLKYSQDAYKTTVEVNDIKDSSPSARCVSKVAATGASAASAI